MTLIPTPFLFRYTIPVRRDDALPRSTTPLLELPDTFRVPVPAALAGTPPFVELSLAWNPQGMACQVRVTGKTRKPRCNPESLANSDAVRIWIDTRDTQSQHRGSRFCHYFVGMPLGGEETGLEPFVRQKPVPRAREEAPLVDDEALLAEAEINETGYRLSIWFPAEALHGDDPGTQPRLGFYVTVQDHDLGHQVLAVDDRFPYESDPSQWLSLELTEESDSASAKPKRGRRPHKSR